MDDPGDRVYRKTDRGMGEVKSRSGGLSARSRTALILVNGVDSLAALRRQALARLAPHYGPDAAVVAGPLLQAANIEAYCAALAALETKVSVYMGRKQAVKLLAGLKPD